MTVLLEGLSADEINAVHDHGGPIDAAMISLKLRTEEQVLSILEQATGFPSATQARVMGESLSSSSAVPLHILLKEGWVPLVSPPGALCIATASPLSLPLLQEVCAALGVQPMMVITTTTAIARAQHARWGQALPDHLVVPTPPLLMMAAPVSPVSPGRPQQPWTIADARAELVLAEDRDALWRCLLRFGACTLTSVVALVRKREGLVGWDVVDNALTVADLRGRLLPDAGLVGVAMQARSGVIGPPTEADPIASWWPKKPRALLVMPIYLDDRCLGVLVGHAGDGAVPSSSLADLNQVLPLFVQQLRRLLLAARPLGRAATPTPTLPPAPVAIDVTIDVTEDALLAPAAGAALLAHQQALQAWQSWSGEPAPPHVVAARRWPHTRDDVMAELAIPARITFSLVAIEAGLVARAATWWSSTDVVPEALLGPAVQAALSPADPTAAHVLLAQAVRNRSLDHAGWHPHLERLRDLQRRGDDDTRIRAIDALRVVRDRGAAQAWIDFLPLRPSNVSEAARSALVEVFVEDHGQHDRRWRAHIDEHGHEPRRQWLLRGLNHNNRAVRDLACAELEDLIPELMVDVGYDVASSASDRARASAQLSERWSA